MYPFLFKDPPIWLIEFRCVVMLEISPFALCTAIMQNVAKFLISVISLCNAILFLKGNQGFQWEGSWCVCVWEGNCTYYSFPFLGGIFQNFRRWGDPPHPPTMESRGKCTGKFISDFFGYFSNLFMKIWRTQ